MLIIVFSIWKKIIMFQIITWLKEIATKLILHYKTVLVENNNKLEKEMQAFKIQKRPMKVH